MANGTTDPIVLTAESIHALYPRAAPAHLRAFETQHAALFDRFGIAHGRDRLHYFLAQIGHESAGLTITEENLRYSAKRMTEVWPRRFPTLRAAEPLAGNPQALANNVYADRMGNGPPASGDGWRYRGRGYIQVTGRDGYARAGDIAGIDLVARPERAQEPDSALLVACAVWEWKRLNPVADRGDFVRVTEIINGGQIGLADRQTWLETVRRVLGASSGDTDAPDVDTLLAVQRALLAAGFCEVGEANGQPGARTRAAIDRFRVNNGLPAGGIDRQLLEALGIERGGAAG